MYLGILHSECEKKFNDVVKSWNKYYRISDVHERLLQFVYEVPGSQWGNETQKPLAAIDIQNSLKSEVLPENCCC